MSKLKSYAKLLRLKHCIKNVLIWLPLVFNESLFDAVKLRSVILGFISFSLMASVVYIINDIQDAPKDRLHPIKKKRPIASGEVTVKEGMALAVICLASSLVFNYLASMTISSNLCLSLYLILNVLYSRCLKNIPIIDITILTSGFVIRLMYGGIITNIPISAWLYLTVITASFYMGLGKRRNELNKTSNPEETRGVLKFYNYSFLDKNMYMCLCMAEVFYALWAVNKNQKVMLWTVPVVIVLGMKYSLDIEGDSDGDPVEVITHDRILWVITVIYVALVFYSIYIR